MTHSRHVATFAVALLVCGTAFALPRALAAQDADARARRVDSIFAEFDKPGSPGAAVAVVRDGRVLLERGYGYASLEHNVRNTSRTVFDVASVSKQFAGLAIAMLVDQGRIRVTDDVRRYIPELHDFGRPITIAHLLHHTSGLRDWPATLSVAGWRFDDVIAYQQILRFAYAQRRLNFVPGAEYTYSNTGYNLLAEVVARVTGKTFRAWTDENLFRPLGMSSSRFLDDHMTLVPGRASSYQRVDGEWRAVTDNLTALGSSSLFSSVTDMARWLVNFDSARVGGRRAMELMRTRAPLNDGSPNQYAFGILHGEYRGQPFFSHSGSWAGFVSYLVYVPEKRFGVVVLANAPNVPVQRAAIEITNTFLGAELSPAAAAATTRAAANVAVSSAELDRYVGWYKLGPGWYVEIRRDGNALLTQATREEAFPLAPRSAREFWVQGYNAAMAFDRDSAGTMVLTYRGQRYPRLASDTAHSPALAELAGDYESAELGTTYTVVVKDSTVTLRHFRHGDHPLRRARGDDWSGPVFFLRSVEFQRDARGRVTGFVVNAGERARDIHFVRRGSERAGPQRISSASVQSPPPLILGEFKDDYNGRHAISDSLWSQGARSRYRINRWRPDARYLIALNDSGNPHAPGKWSRIDWVELTEMAPYAWGFCFSAYDAASAEDAERTAIARPETPRTGCNGRPYTRMQRTP